MARTPIYKGFPIVIIRRWNASTKRIEFSYQISLRGNKVLRSGWFWNKGLAVAGAHRVIDSLMNEQVAA